MDKVDVAPGAAPNSSDKMYRDPNHFRRGESNDYHVNNSWRGRKNFNKYDTGGRGNFHNRNWKPKYNNRNFNYNNKWRNPSYYNDNDYYHNNHPPKATFSPVEEVQQSFINDILTLLIAPSDLRAISTDAEPPPNENTRQIEAENTTYNSPIRHSIGSTESVQYSETTFQKDSSAAVQLSENDSQGNCNNLSQNDSAEEGNEPIQFLESITQNDDDAPIQCLDSSTQNDDYPEECVSFDEDKPTENIDYNDQLKNFLEIVKIETGVDWTSRQDDFFQSDIPALDYLYSNFAEDFDTRTISSTTNELRNQILSEENQSDIAEPSEDCNVSGIDEIPPKTTPSISLVPLSFLIDPNLRPVEEQNDNTEAITQQTFVSKEADSTPTTSSSAVTNDAHFKKPELISKKLINKVANMDKSNIRNVINNPIMKFDVALKMNAKKRLREEIRKQLRNMNFETRKQATGENVVKPDGYIDPENIPPEMLQQFESVLNMQIETMNTNGTEKSIKDKSMQDDALNSGDESFSENCIECINTKLQEEEINNHQQFSLRTKLLNLEFIKQQAILRKCRQPMSDSDDDVCIIEPPETLNKVAVDESSNDSSTTNTTTTSVSTVSQNNIEVKFLHSFKKDVLPNLPDKVRREYELSSGKDEEIAKIYSMCLDKLRTIKWQNEASKPAIDWSNTDDALSYLVQNIRALLNADRNDRGQDRDSKYNRYQHQTSKKYDKRHYNRKYYNNDYDRYKSNQGRYNKPSDEGKRKPSDPQQTSKEESHRKSIEDVARNVFRECGSKSPEERRQKSTEEPQSKKADSNFSKYPKHSSQENNPNSKEPNHRKEDDSSSNNKANNKNNDSHQSKKSSSYNNPFKTNEENHGKNQHKEDLHKQDDKTKSNHPDSKKRSKSREKNSNKSGSNPSPTNTNSSNRKRKLEESVATSTTGNKASTEAANSNTKDAGTSSNSNSITKWNTSQESSNKEKSWRSAGEKKFVEANTNQPPPKVPKITPTPEPIIATPAEKACAEAIASPSSPKGTNTITTAPEPAASSPSKEKSAAKNTNQRRESLITPDSTEKPTDSIPCKVGNVQKIAETSEEMNSQITSSVEPQDKICNTTLNNLKDLDTKLMELNQKKMELEKKIIELQKEKMEIDLTVMQLQNDRFALLSSVVSDSNSFLANNPNLQSVFTSGSLLQPNLNHQANNNKTRPPKPKKPPKPRKQPKKPRKKRCDRDILIESSAATLLPNSNNQTCKDIVDGNPSEISDKISNVSSMPTRRATRPVVVVSPENPNALNLKTNEPKRSLLPKATRKNAKPSSSSITPTSPAENLLPVSCAGKLINIVQSSDSEDEETDTSQVNSSLSSRTVSNGQLKGFRLPIVKIIGAEGYIICASEDGNIYKFDSNTKQLISTFSKHTEAITGMYVDGQGCIYSTSLDGFMKKTSIDNFGLELQSVNVHEPLQAINLCWNVAFLGSRWGNIFTYDLKKNRLNESLLCSVGSTIITLKATKEGPRRIIIISSKGEKLDFRDASTGLLLRTIHAAHNENIYNIVLSGGLLYCGSASNKVFTYDFVTGNEIKTFTTGVGAVSLKLYKNKFLFVGCYDGFIYVFNKDTDEQIGRFPGAGKMILELEIIGEKVLTSSKDNVVQIGDIPKYILTITK